MYIPYIYTPYSMYVYIPESRETITRATGIKFQDPKLHLKHFIINIKQKLYFDLHESKIILKTKQFFTKSFIHFSLDYSCTYCCLK